MKNLLITHVDLDGAGCAIVFRSIYPNIEIQYHDYNTIDAISKELLGNRANNYDKVFFADITPNEPEGLKMINNDKYFLIDHHETRTYLKGNNVIFNTLYSATMLSYLYLNGMFSIVRVIPKFIDAVNAIDMFQLDSPHRKYGEELSLIFQYYGMSEFIERYWYMPDDLNECDNIVIKVLQELRQKYLSHKLEQIQINTDDDNNKYGEVHIGEVGNGLSILLTMYNKNHEPLKYLKVININDKTVSLYSDGFDVSKIAVKNGGGGHTCAAGYPLK